MRPRGTGKYPWLTIPSIAYLTKGRYTYLFNSPRSQELFPVFPNQIYQLQDLHSKIVITNTPFFPLETGLWARYHAFPSKNRKGQTTGTAHKGHWLALSPNRPSGGRSPVLRLPIPDSQSNGERQCFFFIGTAHPVDPNINLFLQYKSFWVLFKKCGKMCLKTSKNQQNVYKT